jgi:protein gp37
VAASTAGSAEKSDRCVRSRLFPRSAELRSAPAGGIGWVIVGGKSGPGARPMDPAWVLNIRDQCQDAHVPFFFKQWGGTRKKKAGRELEGRTWDEMPAVVPYPESA